LIAKKKKHPEPPEKSPDDAETSAESDGPIEEESRNAGKGRIHAENRMQNIRSRSKFDRLLPSSF
jgi:hypothetical protein